MDIKWTDHASERQRLWEQTHGVTRQKVEDVVRNPEQEVPGHGNALVAQARYEAGILRAPFVEEEGQRIILTIYWTSKIAKYWEAEDAGNL